MMVQDAGSLGSSLWTGLAPILATAVAAGITWFVQKANDLVGTTKGYLYQVLGVAIPAVIGYFASKTGFDVSTPALLAGSIVGWLGVHLGVQAASVNPAARR
jgi:hypothetical protein